MHLKREVKAGILLYALLMLAVFSLLLTYALHRQEAALSVYRASEQSHQAAAIATVSEQTFVQEHGKNQSLKEGSYHYQEGTCRYQLEEGIVTLTVELETGQTYRYHRVLPSKSD